MTANTVLCVLSTLGFCFGTQALGWLSMKADRKLGPGTQFPHSARKFARRYAIFAVFVLTIMSLAVAVKSYIELFT